ncbi:DUF947-domain-containing protein [Meredithblackwellia eburnea MCA 4105]
MARPPHKKQRKHEPEPDSDSEQELELDDSEEDEWEQERQQQQPFKQDTSEDDDDDDGTGVAQFESDQGEDYLDEDEDEDQDDHQESTKTKELAAIPFSTLLKAKKQLEHNNLSKKKKNKKRESDDEDDQDSYQAEGSKGSDSLRNGKAAGKKVKKQDRSSKHAPMEMSSKKAVSRIRQIVEPTDLKKKSRDPRFSSLSGQVNPSLFRQSYSFLASSQSAELASLRTLAANPKLASEERDRVEATLRRMESREVERRKRDLEERAVGEWKREERRKREQQGKKGFWLKDSDKKALILKARFDALKDDKKGLRKAVEKKRRKTAQRDKKNMPSLREQQ